MIWSLAEIWWPLALAFLIGCASGSLIFQRLAVSRLAGVQASVHRRLESTLPVLGGRPRAERAPRAAPPSPPAPPAPKAGAPPPPARKAAEPVQAAPPPPPVVQTPPPSPPPSPTAEPVAVERPAPARGGRAARVFEPPVVTVPSPDELAAGRPPALDAPRAGRPDSLRKIKGIGESFEARLHALGIFHFDQIAAWSLKQAAWVAMETGAADRVIKNDWVGQAAALAEEMRSGGAES